MSYKFPVQPAGRLALSVAALLVFATTAFGKDPPAAANAQPAVEMPMQVSTEGRTHAEYLARQDELNQVLKREMPLAAFANPLQVELTQQQIADIGASLPTPLRIGAVTVLDPVVAIVGLVPEDAGKAENAATRGVLTATADGGFVWALTIKSADAGAIRVHVENLSLPAGASLYFYSVAGEAFGPYTGKGTHGTGDIWTESVFGQEGVLQLHMPAGADLKQVVLSITGVGSILPQFAGDLMLGGVTPRGGFCGNEPCIVDATCFNVAAANPAKSAVAKMEWIAGAFIYTCTGGLIADNNPAQNNYFLTANHCISKNNNAGNVQFYWRFATSSCNGACPSNSGWPFKTTGSVVRKTNRRGDFTLLQLNANPPSGSVFLGWTTAPVANSNGTQLYRVSNPNFGPQAYSQHNVDTSAPTCQGWPRGERIYSRDITGATAGGSSGSPVVNGSSQIVGQLSGACGFNPGDPCDSGSNATVDGAFAYYYSSVQPFINP